MKHFAKIVFSAIALMLLVGTFEANAQGIPNEILKKMEEHRQVLSSLKASVKMDKFNSQLDEHDIYEGETMYLPNKGKDALVRIDWSKPQEETLSVVNGQFVIFRPRLNQAIIGKTDKQMKNSGAASSPLKFMNMSKDQLKANYLVVYLGQETVGGNPTWHLKLTPKGADKFKEAELWVDGNGMPIQAKIIEKNNDATSVYLSNLQKNVTINAKSFSVVLPKNVKKVDA